ncbi:MAG: hypothetical protein M5U27_12635 [Gaiella sp.]|nr:hypothetical protein [Gaiella sp.]
MGLNEEEYTDIAEIQSMASGAVAASPFVRLSAGDQSWTGFETFQIEDGKIVRQSSFALGESPPFGNVLTA